MPGWLAQAGERPERAWDVRMTVVVVEPETLLGADVLDGSVRGVFAKITPADIIGALAQDQGFGGGEDEMAWMRPSAGVEPAMRLSALVQMAGAWGGTQLVAPAEIGSGTPTSAGGRDVELLSAL